ncbi:FAD-dependent monooxygenase [Nonomuraea sp. NPDC002799]
MAPERVIVVGAGPTGLALAAELALAGVPCTVLEKRADAPNITRAFGVSARTLDLLDSRGLAEEVIRRGNKVPKAQANVGVYVDFTKLDSRFNFMLIVPQSGTEGVLEDRCRELGVDLVRDAEVVRLTQDGDGVELRVRSAAGAERVERAAYVVGCDGAHSVVREQVGARFVGKRYDVNLLLADVRLSDPPSEVLFGRATPAGIQLLIPFGDGYHRSISFLHGAARGDHPHRLAGTYAPDVTPAGVRLAEALRPGRFVMVDTTPAGIAATLTEKEYAGRVSTLAGQSGGLPAAMLVRPDGYVAWATDDTQARAAGEALTTWLGPP